MTRTLPALLTLAALSAAACAEGQGGPAQPGQEVSPPVPRCADRDPGCEALASPLAAPGCGAILGRQGPPAFPERLSELACFLDGDPFSAAPGVIPFDVRAPLFSEGSVKARFLSLPAGHPMRLPAAPDLGPWVLPDGAVLLKTFAFAPAVGASPQPVEIRVMARAEGRWYFATYGWSAALGDGERVPERGDWREVPAVTPSGGLESLRWWLPSQKGCESCHGRSAPDVIGLTTGQLAREVDYGHVRADQLTALWAGGWLESLPPAEAVASSALADPEEAAAPVEARARAWLEGNCAHCHRPGGYAPADFTMDLRAAVPLPEMGICDRRPRTAGAPRDERLLAPGHPERSSILRRLHAPEPDRMPPDGGTRVDPLGVALLEAWIRGLPGCD